MNLQQQITQIRGQFQAVALHLGKLGTSINTLAAMMGGGHAPSRVGIVPTATPSPRRLSKTGRAKIAAAQKARWAKNKPAAGTGGPQPLGTRKAA